MSKLVRKTEWRAKEIIENILIRDVKNIVNKSGAPYMAFLNIIIGMEFLGACLDERPFQEEQNSEKRIKKILKEVFKSINKNYEKFSKSDHKYNFYKYLRCGMVHQLRPLNDIKFTTRREALEDGHKHLEENEQGYLILVLEDFFDDFEVACKKVLWKIDNHKLTNKKLDEGYISIEEFEA